MKTITLILTSILLYGCSGTLYTTLNPDLSDTSEVKIEGVIAYNSINVIELYKTSILTDKATGNQIGSAPGDCTPGNRIKFSTRTDYSKPYIINYNPGSWETNKFSVELANGVLKSVNTESTPSAPLAGVASILPFITPAKVAPAVVHPTGKPECSSGAKLIGVFHAPEIRPYDEYIVEVNK